MLGAAIFVFVGVDSNHFRYVLDFDVTVQGLVGDLSGGTADHSEHFYWNVWRILVLDGLLHPHSSIPYVQMGRSIAFYTFSLLSRDSCERAFIGQLVYGQFWKRNKKVAPAGIARSNTLNIDCQVTFPTCCILLSCHCSYSLTQFV